MKLHPGSLLGLISLAFGSWSSAAGAAALAAPLKEQHARVIQTVAAYLLASAQQEGANQPELVVKALESNTSFLRYQLEALSGAKTAAPRYQRAFDYAKHVSARTKDDSTSIRDALALLMKTQLQAGDPSLDFYLGVMDAVARRTGIAELAPPKAEQRWTFENATHEPEPDDVRYASFRLCSTLVAVADAIDQFVQAHECDVVTFAEEAEPDFARYKKGP